MNAKGKLMMRVCNGPIYNHADSAAEPREKKFLMVYGFLEVDDTTPFEDPYKDTGGHNDVLVGLHLEIKSGAVIMTDCQVAVQTPDGVLQNNNDVLNPANWKWKRILP